MGLGVLVGARAEGSEAMMIPLWVMVLVVGVLLVIAAGVVGWMVWGRNNGGGDYLPDCGPLGCIIAAVPVALVVAIVMAVWGWVR